MIGNLPGEPPINAHPTLAILPKNDQGLIAGWPVAPIAGRNADEIENFVLHGNATDVISILGSHLSKSEAAQAIATAQQESEDQSDEAHSRIIG